MLPAGVPRGRGTLRGIGGRLRLDDLNERSSSACSAPALGVVRSVMVDSIRRRRDAATPAKPATSSDGGRGKGRVPAPVHVAEPSMTLGQWDWITIAILLLVCGFTRFWRLDRPPGERAARGCCRWQRRVQSCSGARATGTCGEQRVPRTCDRITRASRSRRLRRDALRALHEPVHVGVVPLRHVSAGVMAARVG